VISEQKKDDKIMLYIFQKREPVVRQRTEVQTGYVLSNQNTVGPAIILSKDLSY
jgi:hypothetical protein